MPAKRVQSNLRFIEAIVSIAYRERVTSVEGHFHASVQNLHTYSTYHDVCNGICSLSDACACVQFSYIRN